MRETFCVNIRVGERKELANLFSSLAASHHLTPFILMAVESFLETPEGKRAKEILCIKTGRTKPAKSVTKPSKEIVTPLVENKGPREVMTRPVPVQAPVQAKAETEVSKGVSGDGQLWPQRIIDNILSTRPKEGETPPWENND